MAVSKLVVILVTPEPLTGHPAEIGFQIQLVGSDTILDQERTIPVT